MRSTFSILYLEDDYQDARIFAQIIRKIFEEYEEQTEASFSTEEGVTDYLKEKGIDWIKDYNQFLEYIEQGVQLSEYQMFLLDMRLTEGDGVEGWEIIEKIKEKRGKQASPIWILSNYGFFAQLARQEYNISHFFSKTYDGYNRLKDELVEWFLPGKPAKETLKLTFRDCKGNPVFISISEIVSIEIEDGMHYLYRLNANDGLAHKIGFPPYKILDIAKKQIQEMNIHSLVQISHGVIVNVKLVDRIQGDGKRYWVWLRKRGENKPLSISYPYLRNIRAVYGEDLTVFQ